MDIFITQVSSTLHFYQEWDVNTPVFTVTFNVSDGLIKVEVA